ncbi:MAG: YCF48-related protein [Candidatus Fermentibacteria bacterium]
MNCKLAVMVLVLIILSFTGNSAGQDGWYQQDSGTSAYLLGVFAVDSLTCWATGSVATILNTLDGGYSWTEQSSPVAGTLYSVFFTDASTGWIVGEFGNILHTADAGVNWVEQTNSSNVDLWSVHFVDGNNGWAVGGKFFSSSNVRVICHTSNGGASWSTQHYESYKPSLHGVFFADESTGYAVGEGATILATTNGGSTWVEQTAGITSHLEDVYFTSPDTGFVVGQNGVILYTTDSGANWDQLTSGTTDWLGGAWFHGTETGWTVGGSNDTAVILSTANAGSLWEQQAANTDTLLRDVHFVNLDIGWAVGAYGMIVHTSSGGGTSIEGSHVPDSESLNLRNAPDPFSIVTTVSFNLNSTGQVSLHVFDLSGRLVMIPLDEPLQSGTHSVVVNAEDLDSGVYIYRLDTGSILAYERFVLLR